MDDSYRSCRLDISYRYVFNLDFHVSGVCIHLSKLGIAWADKTLDVRVNLLTVLFAVYGRILRISRVMCIDFMACFTNLGAKSRKICKYELCDVSPKAYLIPEPHVLHCVIYLNYPKS